MPLELDAATFTLPPADEGFETYGTWWLPDRLHQAIHGTLSFDPEQGTTLEVYGWLDADWNPEGLGPLHCPGAIRGTIANGMPMTALGCWETSRASTMPSGPKKVRYRVSTALIGTAISLQSNTLYSMARVRFSHMEEWVGAVAPTIRQYNSAEGSRAFSLQYAQVNHLEVPIPSHGFSAIIESELEMREKQKYLVSLATLTHCQIRPNEPQELHWFMLRMMELRNLFSFLVGSPVSVREFKLRTQFETETFDAANQLSQMTRAYFALPHRKSIEERHRNTMTASLDDFHTIAKTVVPSWFATEVEFQTVRALYFGQVYAPSTRWDSTFLAMTQCLEGFHRLTHAGTYVTSQEYQGVLPQIVCALPQSIPSELRESLKKRLEFGNEVSLRRRFKDLSSTVGKVVATLTGWDNQAYRQKVVDTRNALTHQADSGGREIFQIHELRDCVIKLEILFTCLTLNQLGFDSDQIVLALRRRTEWRSYLV